MFKIEKKQTVKLKNFSQVAKNYFAIILIVAIAVNISFLIREEKNVKNKMINDARQYSKNIISFFDSNARNFSRNGYELLDRKEVHEYYVRYENFLGDNIIRIKAVKDLLSKFVASNNLVIDASIRTEASI